ncbi:MAG: hypothetical protein Q8O84_00465 [Nanoarchaeota archaeon]|nr:hypothetical protein [Nanoarchaeota archaeon]
MKKSLIVFSVIILLVSMSFVFAEITGDAVEGGTRTAIRTSVSSAEDWECDSDSDCQQCEGCSDTCSDHVCVKSTTVSEKIQTRTSVSGCPLGKKLLNGICVSTSTTGIRKSLARGSSLTAGWEEVDRANPPGGKCFIRTQSTGFLGRLGLGSR